MSGLSPRSSERKRSNSNSIPTGSTAVIPRGVANSAVRRRPPALCKDVVFFAEANDVPNDQKVPRKAQSFIIRARAQPEAGAFRW